MIIMILHGRYPLLPLNEADQKIEHSSLRTEYLNLFSDRCTNKKTLKNLFGQPRRMEAIPKIAKNNPSLGVADKNAKPRSA
jgi:hypothetical protein